MQQKAMHNQPQPVGAVIKRERESQGLSIREVSRRSGVSAGQITNIKNSTNSALSRNPDRAKRMRWVEILCRFSTSPAISMKVKRSVTWRR